MQNQSNVVDQYKAARDTLNASYEVEKQRLDELKDAYSAVEQQITASENAINEFAAAVKAAQDAQKDPATSAALENFRAAEGVNYDDVVGKGAGQGGFDQATADQYLADQERAMKEYMDKIPGLDLFEASA